MQMNHHILAKTTTDSILGKFKSEEWNCGNGIGRGFYRVTTDASFPSPDAAFYDEEKKFLVSFEFKPPTETKRGILTGVGQSIAYLQGANISFLVAPERLEDYDLGTYLEKLYKRQIYGKIPTGLIIYKNDNPQEVKLVSKIAENLDITSQTVSKSDISERYWAKHQDLPIPMFHLLLHCYFLRKTHFINIDAFKYCWNNYMISPTVSADFQTQLVLDCSNQIIKTLGGRKNLIFLEKILHDSENMNIEERSITIANAIDTEASGDNYYNSVRKNFVSFLKHIGVIDSEGELTDSGFSLYRLGLANGPNSKIFKDYFAKEVLTTGHHLDLLLDLEATMREKKDLSFNDCLRFMESVYEAKGFIKRNPNRIARTTNTVAFLKYECILWRALNLLTNAKRGVSYVNWKNITEICSLPDL